jgi:hypothetical protein
MNKGSIDEQTQGVQDDGNGVVSTRVIRKPNARLPSKPAFHQ